MTTKTSLGLTPKKGNADVWMPAFLATLRNTANVRWSCEHSGISRETAYKHRKADELFKAEWDSAMEDACDFLEAAAMKRAMTVSDTLLIFLLKAHRPEKYRETMRHELTGKDGEEFSFTMRLEKANDNDNGT